MSLSGEESSPPQEVTDDLAQPLPRLPNQRNHS